MSAISSVYKINPLQGWIPGSSESLVLDSADYGVELRKELQIKALIRSGDYFEVIASEIDRISSSLESDHSAMVDLQRIVRELLYVQSEYKISEK